jgi:DivIVA domain-containing protein
MTTDAWYDEQRRLTPDQVQAATFPLTRWGRHGYEEEAVRAFLADVPYAIAGWFAFLKQQGAPPAADRFTSLFQARDRDLMRRRR